jgi:hypothetical protein
MTSPLLNPETVEINGKTFEIGRLSFARSKPVYMKLQRLLQMVYANDKNLEEVTNPFMFACLANAVTEADLEFYIAEFAAVTSVEMGGKKYFLRVPAAQETVFGQNFEDIFDWLDAAVRISFKGPIEKMRGALLKLKERAEREQEQETSKSQDSSTGT